MATIATSKRRESAAARSGEPAGSRSVPAPVPPVSHNLQGQKLGKKGRSTRERILKVTAELLETGEDLPISLSAVARKAALGMTSLYNYFTDLTELLLAVLEPVMASGEEAYSDMLRARWNDAEIGDHCLAFVKAYHGFWSRHTRLLHLRNSMGDTGDHRMLLHRIMSTQPLIALIAGQMDGDPEQSDAPAYAMATVLMTGIERTVTVVTDTQFTGAFGANGRRNADDHYLVPQARLMELAIRDMRARIAEKQGGG